MQNQEVIYGEGEKEEEERRRSAQLEEQPEKNRSEELDGLEESSEWDQEQNRLQLTPSPSVAIRPPSFAHPFPVRTISAASLAVSQQLQQMGTPLTNHEIYELTKKSQQQPASSGSFKYPKRPSHTSYNLGRRLDRQTSVIVGTPGFRERYGKLKSVG